jgi:hypothetical protein
VDAELTKKGLQKVPAGQNPDIYVYYHVVTQEVFDSTTTDDGFGWGSDLCLRGVIDHRRDNALFLRRASFGCNRARVVSPFSFLGDARMLGFLAVRLHLHIVSTTRNCALPLIIRA